MSLPAMPRGLLFAFCLTLCAAGWCSAGSSSAHAQAEPDLGLSLLDSPYSPLVREQYYERLAKSPWRALGWELLAPGAGHFYVGTQVAGAATLGASLLGASLWIAGAVRERPPLMWSGVGTFAAARAVGAVSAPVAALLLNAAFRRQLGLQGTF